MSGASLRASTELHDMLTLLRPVEGQACAQACVQARHPEAKIVRGARGYVVWTIAGVLGEGRTPAYWHEEAWINAVEELEGR